jgi:hypothetical protein
VVSNGFLRSYSRFSCAEVFSKEQCKCKCWALHRLFLRTHRPRRSELENSSHSTTAVALKNIPDVSHVVRRSKQYGEPATFVQRNAASRWSLVAEIQQEHPARASAVSVPWGCNRGVVAVGSGQPLRPVCISVSRQIYAI